MSVSATGSFNHSLILFYSNSCAIFQLSRLKLQGLIHPNPSPIADSTSTANSRTCRHDTEAQLNISCLTWTHDQTLGQQDRRTISSQSSCHKRGFAGYYRDIANCEFPQFTPPSNESIKNVLSSLSNKTCSLDPIPTHVIKDNISSVLAMVSGIVRQSFSNGIFPTSLKTSLVRPKLKKPDLKPHLLANYGPIANIPFLSKVLEKSAAIQVHNYLNDNDLFPALQSAYRKYHSTETALLRVTDDILKTLDSNGEVILVLLDLSAAFDTLDHQILLARLRKYFNFTETALKWFSSYLLGRSQRVSIADATSPPRCLEYGVPQGSILGPLLFSLYMAPLQNVIRSHGLDSMFYADDTKFTSSLTILNNPLTLSVF